MNEHHPANQPDREPVAPQVPRVWIGSLADYSAGCLTGDWIDAAVPDADLIAAAQATVARSHTPDAEEWAIFDHEGFGPWRPAENDDLAVVATVARGIREHGPAFAAWADLHDADPQMLLGFEDAFLGEYDSPAAWAATVMDDVDLDTTLAKHLPEELRRYLRFDYDAWARDAWLGGDVVVVPTGRGHVWIFQAEVS